MVFDAGAGSVPLMMEDGLIWAFDDEEESIWPFPRGGGQMGWRGHEVLDILIWLF